MLTVLFLILALFIGYNLIFFKEEKYFFTRYKLINEACIIQVFLLTFLLFYQKNISCNHDIGGSISWVNLTNFEVAEIDYY